MREQLGLRGLLLSQGRSAQLNSLADSATLNSFSPGLGQKASGGDRRCAEQFSQPVNLSSMG